MAPTEQAAQTKSAKNGKPSPELVRQVTEKVAALWRRDLALERERERYRQSF
ncbi:MAG: hypothetical protein R6X32_20070 [Chloroflexota bacterium]